MFVVGADGCQTGWIAVALDSGVFAGATHFSKFQDLVAALDEAAAIGVDIPIGLISEGSRDCDELTREFVGPRRNSVFRTPVRDAISLESYEDASAVNRERSGYGMSKQMYNLRRKILEVDAVVRSQTPEEAPPSSRQGASAERRFREQARRMEGRDSAKSLRKFARIITPARPVKAFVPEGPVSTGRNPLPSGRIVEVHPEASFRELAGEPLKHSKKTWNGMMQRMRLLEKAGINIPAELGEIGRVGVDDVLDAAAIAWTANRYANNRARSLPPQQLWQHSEGQVIAIWI